MKQLLLLLFLPILLFGSKILSYNIYERSDHVDIMLTFDTPYEGKLSQIKKKNKIILKLQSASIESPKIKNVNSKYLYKMVITPIGSRTEIILKTAPNIIMSASKTSDAYGLKLRFSKTKTETNPLLKQNSENGAYLQNLPTKKDNNVKNSYYIVIAILLIGIIIMFWLKRKMGSTQTKGKQPWLFKGNSPKEGVSIRFQKPLDQKNRVVMLDFEENSYLVVIGNSNILLDKYEGGKVSTQNEFDEMLNQNRSELDAYLQLDSSAEDESLYSYKQKVSEQTHNFV